MDKSYVLLQQTGHIHTVPHMGTDDAQLTMCADILLKLTELKIL